MLIRSWAIVATLTTTVLLGSTSRAMAQPGSGGAIGPIARPTVSPYLNLLRNGNSAAFNYFSLVRPEKNAIRAFQGLQAGVTNNQATINSYIGSSQIGVTGLPTQFMNHGVFFMNTGMLQGGGTSGGSGATAAGRTNMGGRGNVGGVAPKK